MFVFEREMVASVYDAQSIIGDKN